MPTSAPSTPDPTDPLVPPRIPREIWVLVAAAFCVSIGFGIVAPVLPQFAAGFGVGVQAASAIVSVFALMRLVSAPAGGVLVDKLGERRIYMTGLLIVALSTGACALVVSYWQLMVFRGLGGIGSAMFAVSSSAMMVRLAPPAIRGRCASALGAAFLIGNIAGPIVGGLTAGFGHRVPFLVYAVMLIVATAVVGVSTKGARTYVAGSEGGSRPVMGVAEAWQNPAYRAVLVSGFGNGWANFGVRVALVPLFAAAIPELGAQWAGLALTVFAAGNALALTLAGRATDRFGRKPFIIGGFLLNGVATAALGFSSDIITLVITSLLAGAGAGVANPAQQAAVADVIGAERNGGKVLSGFQMAQDAGTISGPIVSGWLVGMALTATAGYSTAFMVTGAIAILGACAWLPVAETRGARA